MKLKPSNSQHTGADENVRDEGMQGSEEVRVLINLYLHSALEKHPTLRDSGGRRRKQAQAGFGFARCRVEGLGSGFMHGLDRVEVQEPRYSSVLNCIFGRIVQLALHLEILGSLTGGISSTYLESVAIRFKL